MSSLTDPQSNYAAWERVVAELMPATSEPAGPLCRRDAKPSRHGWHPGKPPPKPLPSSTHSFLGCAERKSDCPETSHPARTHAPASRRAREQLSERQSGACELTIFVASQSENIVKPPPTKGGFTCSKHTY